MTRVRPAPGPISAAGQLAALGVEVGVGLVEQQQLGLVQDAAADRQPLAHPGRELGDPLVGAALHPDRGEQLLDPRLGAPRRDPVQAGVEAQVLAAAEVAVEQRLVAEVADPAAQLPGLARAARSRAPATSPPLGRSRVARIRSSVVLPAPLGPSTTSVSPAASSRPTPSSAVRSP